MTCEIQIDYTLPAFPKIAVRWRWFQNKVDDIVRAPKGRTFFLPATLHRIPPAETSLAEAAQGISGRGFLAGAQGLNHPPKADESEGVRSDFPADFFQLMGA